MNTINKMLKYILLFVSVFLVIMIIYGIWLIVFGLVSNKSFVVFFNVGQGDSILIKTTNKRYILIDAGPDNSVLRQLGKYLPYFRRRLDLVIISHYHEDHFVGLVEIIRRYQVDLLVVPANSELTNNVSEVFNRARQRSVNVVMLKESLQIELDKDCLLTLVSPDILTLKENGNNSIISLFDCRSQRFMFSGDNEQAVERAFLNSGYKLQADVLKAAHHGSITSNSDDFLQAVDPEIMIISVGRDNKFNLPHLEVVRRAEEMGITVLRTDIFGDIFLNY